MSPDLRREITALGVRPGCSTPAAGVAVGAGPRGRFRWPGDYLRVLGDRPGC
jgi:hypothetical protein